MDYCLYEMNIIFSSKMFLLLMEMFVTMTQQLNLTFTIYENVPIKSKVGDLLQMIKKLNATNPIFTVPYCDKNQFNIDYLSLNHISQSICTNVEIDREGICPELSGTSVDCVITMVLTLDHYLLNIFILILDLNDNSPTFKDSERHYQLLESEVLGFQIKLDQAIDKDSSKNSVFHYSLDVPYTSQKQQQFALNKTSTSLSLILLRDLDYETVTRYILRLVACDGGKPQLCSSQKININIIDVNDEAPKFSTRNYTVLVQENITVATEILRIHAVDRESGDFGKVLYRLSNFQGYHAQYISVDINSGSVVLKKSLIDTDKLQFIVEAHDSATHDSKFDWSQVTVHVIDINNHSPNISIRSSHKIRQMYSTTTQWFEIDLFENNKENSEIAFLNVVDKDRGRNADIKCFIVSENIFVSSVFNLTARVRLNKNTFQYKFLSLHSIDREVITNPILINITCQDNGVTKLRSHVLLHINVLDGNEFPAIFSKGSYSISVYEEICNVTVLFFSVTDKDHTSYNQFFLRSSTVFEFHKYFTLTTINQWSGEVRLSTSLDREKTSRGEFIIVALNRAQNDVVRTSTSVVRVLILDVNDNTPQYVGKTSFEIKENTPSFSDIGDLKFEDRDAGENGKISIESFSCHCVNPSTNNFVERNLFSITKMHTLRSKSEFDYESMHQCIISITFHDHGALRRRNKVTITVNVRDENDNDPDCVFPSTLDRLVNVSSYDLRVGSRLARVRAVDRDSVSAGKLSYHLLHASETIAIDPISGEVVLKTSLKSGIHEFWILVSDNGRPARNCTSNLTVNIYNETILHSLNTITRVVISMILVPALVVVLTGCLLIPLIVLCKRRRERYTAKGAALKKRNFVLKNPKVTLESEDHEDSQDATYLQMTNLKNLYFSETDREQEYHQNDECVSGNIGNFYVKKSKKMDCDLCSSIDSGQGASEEDILLSNYKSLKSEKASSQHSGNYIFPPLLEEDINSHLRPPVQRAPKYDVDESHDCYCHGPLTKSSVDNTENILSLLQCPIHSHMITLLQNPSSRGSRIIVNPYSPHT